MDFHLTRESALHYLVWRLTFNPVSLIWLLFLEVKYRVVNNDCSKPKPKME